MLLQDWSLQNSNGDGTFQITRDYRATLNCQKQSRYNHHKGKQGWDGCPVGGGGSYSKPMEMVTLYKARGMGSQPGYYLYI